MIWEQMRDIWLGLPKEPGENLPRQASLTASKLGPILTHCWRFRKTDDSSYTIEHMGNFVTEAWGKDMTGRNFVETIAEVDRSSLLRLYDKVLKHPCGMFFRREAEKGDGGLYRLTTVGFPFADGNGQPTVIAGTYEVEKIAQERPFSGVMEFETAVLLDYRLIDLGAGVPAHRAISTGA